MRLPASKIQPGMIIRCRPPYTYWLDWQRVTAVSHKTGYIEITRADGGIRLTSPRRYFDVTEV